MFRFLIVEVDKLRAAAGTMFSVGAKTSYKTSWLASFETMGVVVELLLIRLLILDVDSFGETILVEKS